MKKIYCTLNLLFVLTIAFTQNTYYVNDNSISNDAFTSSTGSDANPGTAALPFATIQHAADAATEGSIIYVDAGVYFEQVTLNKGLSLFGVNSGVTIVWKPAIINPPPGTFTEPGTIQTAQNIGDVHIRDMSVTGDDNGVAPIVLQTGGSVKYCRLINGSQGIFFRVDPAIKNALIENNYIRVSAIGINCQGSGLTAILTNNTIELTNPGFAAGVFAGLDFGPLVRFTAFGNLISNYNYVGFLANSYNTNITQNSILGTGQHAIEQGTNSLGFATCNWFGTTNAGTIASKVSGLFSYTPYLTNGANSITNNGSGGFVPVASSCGEGVNNFYVNDNSRTNDVFTTAVGSNANAGTSTAPFATLSYAISVVPANSVIHVDAGTYTEQVIIDRGIVINGAGRELTNFIKPASALVPAPGPFTEIGLFETTQGIGDVHIRNISVNSVDGSSQNIIIQSGGSVKNCKLLNGGQGVFFRYASGSKNAAVEFNIIQPTGIGINCQGAGLTANIMNNTISNPSGYYSGIFAGLDFGFLSQITITNNKISNYSSVGILANSNSSNVTNNSIVGTQGIAIQGNTLNATCNWYGSNTPAIAGPIIYSPFLINGTDNDNYNQGFQPVPGSCIGIQHRFYVNDNVNIGNVFTSAVGDDNNSGAPSAPLATVNAAIGKALAGDTIYVDAGNYAEQVIINKGITITGAGQNFTSFTLPTTVLTPAPGLFTEIGLFETTQGIGDVHISNLSINSNNQSSHNILIQSGGSVKNCKLLNGAQGVFFRIESAVKTVVVENNTILNPFIGVNCQGSSITATIQNNSISGATGIYSGVFAGLDFGPLLKLTINNNTINNYGLYGGSGMWVSSNNGNYNLNSITGTENFAIERYNGTGNTPNATCNWFGTTNAAIINPKISGAINYTPYLTNGADNDPANGFQPVPNSCNGLPPTIVLNTFSNVTCNGGSNGSINITASNGNTPFTYTWVKDGDPAFVSHAEDPSNLAAGTYRLAIVDGNGTTIYVNATGVVHQIQVTIIQPAILTATASGTNNLCNGNTAGTATVLVNGGTAPYTYLWSNSQTTTSISNLATAIYNVTATDANGCTANSVYEVTSPAVLIATANGSNVSCFGGNNGTANVLATGGKSPYTYLWDNNQTTAGISNLVAGIYTVTVTDANGCTTTSSYEVAQPAILTATASGTNNLCYGNNAGTASVVASGGTAPYTYLWSNNQTTVGISNLAAGIYTVTVTDVKGCTATSAFEVTEPAILTATASGTNINCFGGNNGTASVLVAGGKLPYNYLWNNSATGSTISNLVAATYTITTTDANGCTVNAAYTVMQPTLLTVTVTGTTASCNGSATANVAGGTSPYTYLWNNGATTASISNVPAGTYAVTVKDAHNCTISGSFTITGNSPINPVATIMNVGCFGGSNGNITVTSAGGVAPRTYNLNGAAFQANNVFNNLSAGTYIVGVKDANGCSDFVTKTVTQPVQLVVVLDSIRKPCAGVNGGRIYITASGGTGTKTYSWTGPGGYTSIAQDPNNLAAGTYNLIVNDNKGCTASTGVTLTAWPSINISEVVTPVGCWGDFTGAINVTVSGGTGSSFIFAWNGPGTIVLPATKDISNLKAGNYILSVTDAGSGCTVQKTIIVTQPLSSLNVTATNPPNITTCGGSTTITATGTGGTAPYEYSLDGAAFQVVNTFTLFTAGIHNITIRDVNGCTKIISKTVTDTGSDSYEPNNTKNQSRLISIGTSVNARIALTSDVADWFKFTTSSSGTYTLSVSHPVINYAFNLYSGTNNSPALTPLSTTATTKEYNLSGNTTYYIQLTGALSYDCYTLVVNQSGSLLVNKNITKITETADLPTVTAIAVAVYPNPHQGAFNLQISSPEETKATIQIITVDGKIISSKDIRLQKGNNNLIRFKDINKSILFYRLIVNNKSISGKIIGPN
jgi:DNA-binding cell septation regulator SpoVG